MEELQNGCGLDEINSNFDSFDWSKFYYFKVIPSFQQRISTNATNKFNDWLHSIREASPKIGQFALAQAANIQVREILIQTIYFIIFIQVLEIKSIKCCSIITFYSR